MRLQCGVALFSGKGVSHSKSGQLPTQHNFQVCLRSPRTLDCPADSSIPAGDDLESKSHERDRIEPGRGFQRRRDGRLHTSCHELRFGVIVHQRRG